MDNKNLENAAKTNNKSKILKISRVCKIVTKVLYVLDCTLTLAFAILAIVLPLTNEIKSLKPAECAIMFSILALYCFFMIDFLWNTIKFFDTINKQQSVFGEKITKSIRRIALSSLILSTVPAIIGSILIHAIVPASEVVFRIEIVGIMASVVLFFISLFFKHGAELQKRDDETL